MKTVRIGFIGAGIVSDLHAEGIRACPDSELVGLWNRTPQRAEEKSRLFGCRVYSSAEALVADPDLDAVFVLTNLETHRRYALLALQAGKHVLVEKPVGVDIEEIREIRAAAAKAGLVCMPGHNYIYEASLVRSRQLIQQGKLGKLVSIYGGGEGDRHRGIHPVQLPRLGRAQTRRGPLPDLLGLSRLYRQ